MNLKKRTLAAVAVLLLSCIGLHAQKINVKGIVLDDEGIPFPGAGVVEMGANNGVSTDLDGLFSINVKPNSTLEVTFIGYEASQIKVGSKNVDGMKIVLKQERNQLAPFIFRHTRSLLNPADS